MIWLHGIKPVCNAIPWSMHISQYYKTLQLVVDNNITLADLVVHDHQSLIICQQYLS